MAGLALTLGLAAAPAAEAKPPVWIVRSHDTTIVMFGSIHLLPPGLDWRPPELDDALAKASEIWFELPINDASDNQAAAASLARGGLPKGRSLIAMLTPDQADGLRKAAAQLNAMPSALDRMQPWMAELTLSVAEDARDGADSTHGVEDQLQATAPATARRLAFETADQQIEFLAGTPVKDQLASLGWTLTEINEDPRSYQRVVDEWMAGDVDGLRHDALDTLQRVSPTLYERLIGGRNRRWAQILSKRMKGPPRTIVVVVGVGHLIGPGGLPALMRARGYQVDGP